MLLRNCWNSLSVQVLNFPPENYFLPAFFETFDLSKLAMKFIMEWCLQINLTHWLWRKFAEAHFPEVPSKKSGPLELVDIFSLRNKQCSYHLFSRIYRRVILAAFSILWWRRGFFACITTRYFHPGKDELGAVQTVSVWCGCESLDSDSSQMYRWQRM